MSSRWVHAQGFTPKRRRTEQILVVGPADIRLNQHDQPVGGGLHGQRAGERRGETGRFGGNQRRDRRPLADAARLVRIGIVGILERRRFRICRL